MAPRAKSKSVPNPAEAALFAGWQVLKKHPLFGPLADATSLRNSKGSDNLCPPDGYVVVCSYGVLHCHPTRRASAENWTYVLAHALLHLGFGHPKEVAREREWNAACCAFVTRFLKDLKLGQPPEFACGHFEITAQNEEALYRLFCEQGIAADLSGLGTAGLNHCDFLGVSSSPNYYSCQYGSFGTRTYEELLADGLMAAVTSAVNVAGGLEPYLGAGEKLHTAMQQARSWFISSYPLLGALAAAFKIVEDVAVCQRLNISIAAVDAEAKEIYCNPNAKMNDAQARFVIAHELLHVGLQHEARQQGRDPYLWNVACDYVINGWLVEMGIGEFPHFGGLHDPALKGQSAEEIYLIICKDLRKYRKLATFRGIGCGDMLRSDLGDWWRRPQGMALDEFYRSCLAQGLSFHRQAGRGLLPAGLVEEINALSQPPIAWDVELAQWFDLYFAPLHKKRSFARISRRQASSPDIPRPRYVPEEALLEGRTFAVVLDTSGSMDRKILAKALGSIASYCMSRDVPAVRLVFCDAYAYDEGYVAAETIAQRLRVRGRGGTVLQPGIDLLESAEDFPTKGPILIITDGFCDNLSVKREHAYLLPQGRYLPFHPKGPVFRIT